MTPEVLCIGECMVEMAQTPDGLFRLGFGGDTFNTAVYLARAGVSTYYATGLGDDRYSAAIIALAERENVDTRFATMFPGRTPGLYVIETDASGERSFLYWRDTSPARDLFDAPTDALLSSMQCARMIYLSGISLWLFRRTGRNNLFAALDNARLAGAKVVFDGNFRRSLWKDAHDEARAALIDMYRRTDIALPTCEDECELWGDADAHAVIERITALGVPEIVLKRGPESALIRDCGRVMEVPVPSRVVPVDTTAAGDSFNAGYLAARLFGSPPEAAALAGHRLASVVITHRGAVVPKTITDGVLPVRPAPQSSLRISQGS